MINFEFSDISNETSLVHYDNDYFKNINNNVTTTTYMYELKSLNDLLLSIYKYIQIYISFYAEFTEQLYYITLYILIYILLYILIHNNFSNIIEINIVKIRFNLFNNVNFILELFYKSFLCEFLNSYTVFNSIQKIRILNCIKNIVFNMLDTILVFYNKPDFITVCIMLQTDIKYTNSLQVIFIEFIENCINKNKQIMEYPELILIEAALNYTIFFNEAINCNSNKFIITTINLDYIINYFYPRKSSNQFLASINYSYYEYTNYISNITDVAL
jgi:hypothetical protein